MLVETTHFTQVEYPFSLGPQNENKILDTPLHCMDLGSNNPARVDKVEMEL